MTETPLYLKFQKFSTLLVSIDKLNYHRLSDVSTKKVHEHPSFSQNDLNLISQKEKKNPGLICDTEI